jgi:hypothetical protein
VALPGRIGLVFVVLAAVFLVAALRAGHEPGTRSAARKAWMRVAIVFAIVGLGLQLVPVLVAP